MQNLIPENIISLHLLSGKASCCASWLFFQVTRFHYMAIADNRQRYMPLPDDRLPGRGQQLAYPEAVLLVDPVEPEFKGEVQSNIPSRIVLNAVFYLCSTCASACWLHLNWSIMCRWTISINIHVRTKIIRCMDGYVLTHQLVFGKLHLAMNFEMEDPSNKTWLPMWTLPPLQ